MKFKFESLTSNYVKLYTSACQIGIKNSTNSQRIFKWDVSTSGRITEPRKEQHKYNYTATKFSIDV